MEKGPAFKPEIVNEVDSGSGDDSKNVEKFGQDFAIMVQINEKVMN